MKTEGNGTKVSSIRKTKGCGVIDKLGPKTTSKSQEIKGLPGEKAFVFTLEPMCYLEIRGLECLTEKAEVKNVIKRKCPIPE